MDKLLYISTGIPVEEVERIQKTQYNFTSNALQPISVFHGNIITGLSECYDEVVALCGVPISRKNYNIKYYNTTKIKKKNITYVIPSFINYPLIKQCMLIIEMFFFILKWSIINKNDNKNIIVDGTFYTGLLSFACISNLINTKVMAIIVDYYEFMCPERKTKAQKLYYKLLEHVDSFVFVTKELERLININNKDYMIMEGLVNISTDVDNDVQNIENCFVYAGGLHEIYGIKNLVDAFHESEVSYELHLYGNGDMIDYINIITQKDERIKYKGIVSHKELLTIERKAKVLINPRPIYGKLDTRYNFPSKLMEYMQSGRPVMTTKLLGIPEEYKEYMIFIEDDSKDGIKKSIQNIVKYSDMQLEMLGKKAQKFVNENKNNHVIAHKMYCVANKEGTVNERKN